MRPPAVAGMFYPGDAAGLRDELARMGWEVRDGKDGQKVKKL